MRNSHEQNISLSFIRVHVDERENIVELKGVEIACKLCRYSAAA